MFEIEEIKERNTCPRCQTARLKAWNELTTDEKFVFERLPASAILTAAERRKNLFCPRCHFETRADGEERV